MDALQAWLQTHDRTDALTTLLRRMDKGKGTGPCGRGWVGTKPNCKRSIKKSKEELDGYKARAAKGAATKAKKKTASNTKKQKSGDSVSASKKGSAGGWQDFLIPGSSLLKDGSNTFMIVNRETGEAVREVSNTSKNRKLFKRLNPKYEPVPAGRHLTEKNRKILEQAVKQGDKNLDPILVKANNGYVKPDNQ